MADIGYGYNPFGTNNQPTQTNPFSNYVNTPEYQPPKSNNGGIFTQTPEVSPTGDTSKGLNPAQQQGVSNAIGTAAQLGSSVIAGVSQYNQGEKARQEARDIANQNRIDTLKQQSVTNAQQTRARELEEKQFALKKKKDDFNLKIDMFIRNVSNDIKNKQSFMTGADQMFGDLIKNEQYKNMLVQFAKGEV